MLFKMGFRRDVYNIWAFYCRLQLSYNQVYKLFFWFIFFEVLEIIKLATQIIDSWYLVS